MSGLSLFLGIPGTRVVNSPIQLVWVPEPRTYSAGLSGVSQTGKPLAVTAKGFLPLVMSCRGKLPSFPWPAALLMAGKA